MTMMINIQDHYLGQLKTFIKSLPVNAVEIKDSLDTELSNRINNYQNNKAQSVSFDNGLDAIRSKLISKI
ncbi:MAG: hypothetical protein Q9M32_00840 [Sulfurimonas sp.]|nr:hypothetical protein [Sulfurimonas sp.]MDQ7060989.1 hypothetical protein [Sulfurimonas sp.]